MGGKNYPELDILWRKGVELYRGYVDDPRNTDNAWMETVVVNFHDNNGYLNNVTLKVRCSRIASGKLVSDFCYSQFSFLNVLIHFRLDSKLLLFN